MSVKELYAQSELVILGEYIGSESVRPSKDAGVTNIGVVKVEAVLKGEGGQTIAFLSLPPARAGGLRSSADLSFAQSQRGLWYLKKIADGLYVADRPDRFVPLDEAQKQLRQLNLK